MKKANKYGDYGKDVLLKEGRPEDQPVRRHLAPGMDYIIFLGVIFLIGIVFRLATTYFRPSPPPAPAGPKEVSEYFVIDEGDEDYGGELGKMATELDYYDFDAMLEDYFGQYGEVAFNQYDCLNGDVIYSALVSTKCWDIELCTCARSSNDSVYTYIILYDPADDSYNYQSLPEIVKYNTDNVITNRHPGGDVASRFEIERKAFVDFIMLAKYDVFNQPGLLPFEAAKIPYQKVTVPTTPDDFSPAN